jgi:hypothetical protein
MARHTRVRPPADPAGLLAEGKRTATMLRDMKQAVRRRH